MEVLVGEIVLGEEGGEEGVFELLSVLGVFGDMFGILLGLEPVLVALVEVVLRGFGGNFVEFFLLKLLLGGGPAQFVVE